MRPGLLTAPGKRLSTAASTLCGATTHVWACCSPMTELAREANHPCGLDRGHGACAPRSTSSLPDARGIRSGYYRESGGCLRFAAFVAKRSTSTRSAGSSRSTRRSGNRPAILASLKQMRSGEASCNSSAIDGGDKRTGNF
jgi:hypothetical protein